MLSLQDRKSAVVLQLSMVQARMLAVELRGLATDHCSLHHLVLAVSKALGGDVAGVLIKGVDLGQVTGAVRLEHQDRIRIRVDVSVDVAAALAIALHLGLPIFLDSMHLLREDRLEPIAASNEPSTLAPLPEAFREVIESLDFASPLDDEEREERGL